MSYSYSTRFSMILFLIALFGKEAVLGSKYKLSLKVSAADFLELLILPRVVPFVITDLDLALAFDANVASNFVGISFIS